MMRFSIFFIGLLFSLNISSRSLPDLELKREREFTGSGLFGFMNGGAELYLEYGVEKLVTRDIAYKGEEYTVDIYDMPTPKDAFGIYSLHTFKCIEADVSGGINCLSTYQLQAAIGEKYISIVFQSGSSKARENIYDVLYHYVDTANVEKVIFPTEIELNPPYSSHVKYLKGNLSISNAQPSLSDLLNGISFSEIWLIGNKDKNALIHFSNEKDKEKLINALPPELIISEGKDYLYITCPEKKISSEDYNNFGF